MRAVTRGRAGSQHDGHASEVDGAEDAGQGLEGDEDAGGACSGGGGV